MSDKQPNQEFKISQITFPKLDFTFFKTPPTASFNQAFRVEVLITDEKQIRILFGTAITSKDFVNANTPMVRITVEAIANFELKEPLGEIKKVSEIPLVGNMLAIIYPFIREKVNYCFSNNGYQLWLGPVNTFELLAQQEAKPDAIKLTDHRKEKRSLEKNIKESFN